MDQEKDVVIFLGLVWGRVYLGKKLLIEGFMAGLQGKRGREGQGVQRTALQQASGNLTYLEIEMEISITGHSV
jgi:hypothetical protein